MTYTNDDRTIARWLEKNVYNNGAYGAGASVRRRKTSGGDWYKYVGMDMEVRIQQWQRFLLTSLALVIHCLI